MKAHEAGAKREAVELALLRRLNPDTRSLIDKTLKVFAAGDAIERTSEIARRASARSARRRRPH